MLDIFQRELFPEKRGELFSQRREPRARSARGADVPEDSGEAQLVPVVVQAEDPPESALGPRSQTGPLVVGALAQHPALEEVAQHLEEMKIMAK